eukprot:11809757-Karenia_brevis.AAC.1
MFTGDMRPRTFVVPYDMKRASVDGDLRLVQADTVGTFISPAMALALAQSFGKDDDDLYAPMDTRDMAGPSNPPARGALDDQPMAQ